MSIAILDVGVASEEVDSTGATRGLPHGFLLLVPSTVVLPRSFLCALVSLLADVEPSMNRRLYAQQGMFRLLGLLAMYEFLW